MPSFHNELGAFQFDNLIHNRVPFALVNLGADFEGLYKSIFRMHIDAQTVMTAPETALADVASRFPSKDIPVVIICETGERSGPLVERFEAAGYLNVFYIQGGLRGLRAELAR